MRLIALGAAAAVYTLCRCVHYRRAATVMHDTTDIKQYLLITSETTAAICTLIIITDSYVDHCNYYVSNTT